MIIKRITASTIYVILSVLFILALFVITQAATNPIDATNKWAWSTNAGWINFRPTHGGVMIYDDHLEGSIWGENIGWISLGTFTQGGAHTYPNDAADNYGVNNDGSGNLSGYAWGTNVGWINFNPTHSQVTIDSATGEFDGYAWGENIGWIHFKDDDGGGPNAYMVALVEEEVIDTRNRWAWSTNAGWINFAPRHGGIAVYDDHVEGTAWGENVGWIRLGTTTGGGVHTYANDSARTYGVNNDGCGNLSGFAWGTNVGWISFNPTHNQVTIDPFTGEFDGYAWGENTGWIHFKDDDGANTYKIVIDWVRSLLDAVTPAISVSGVDVQLDWAAVRDATSYNIYRSQDDPYFTPRTVYDNATTISWTDRAAAGNPDHNYFYIVRAADCAGTLESADSQRLGAFDFGIVPGS